MTDDWISIVNTDDVYIGHSWLQPLFEDAPKGGNILPSHISGGGIYMDIGGLKPSTMSRVAAVMSGHAPINSYSGSKNCPSVCQFLKDQIVTGR